MATVTKQAAIRNIENRLGILCIRVHTNMHRASAATLPFMVPDCNTAVAQPGQRPERGELGKNTTAKQ